MIPVLGKQCMFKTLWIASRLAVVPILFGYLSFAYLFSSFSWNHELFHTLLESSGSLTAFIVAFIIFNMIKVGNLKENYFWLVFT